MKADPFFIVGCPRSGTTMVQQALNRHSEVLIPPETAFFSLPGLSRRQQRAHFSRLDEDLQIELPWPRGDLRQPHFLRAAFMELQRLYLQAHPKPTMTLFGEKTPEHLNRLDIIQRTFPKARVILLVRDGRDVALSLRRLPWTSRDLYVNFALWLYCYRLRKRAQRSCSLPLLCLRYEDIVRDPEYWFRRILGFLGLSFEPQVISGLGSQAGIPDWELPWKRRALEPITADRLGLWRQNLTLEELSVLERWGGKALKDLHYDLRTTGTAPLPRLFYLRVAYQSLLWLAFRPSYRDQKRLWTNRTLDAAVLPSDQPGVVPQTSDGMENIPL